jgi:hypothetical protein
MSLILMKKSVRRMGLSRMVDHMKPTLRPKSDQEFSHSLSEERALLTALRVNQRGAGQACRAGMRPLLGCVMHYSRHSLGL